MITLKTVQTSTGKYIYTYIYMIMSVLMCLWAFIEIHLEQKLTNTILLLRIFVCLTLKTFEHLYFIELFLRHQQQQQQQQQQQLWSISKYLATEVGNQ